MGEAWFALGRQRDPKRQQMCRCIGAFGGFLAFVVAIVRVVQRTLHEAVCSLVPVAPAAWWW